MCDLDLCATFLAILIDRLFEALARKDTNEGDDMNDAATTEEDSDFEKRTTPSRRKGISLPFFLLLSLYIYLYIYIYIFIYIYIY